MDNSVVREYYQIIKNKISQGDFTSALGSINKLLRNFPRNEWGYYYKGICEFALEDYENAIKDYKTAIKLKPLFAKAYFNLGICYHTLEYYDFALIALGRALVIFARKRDAQARQRCIDALQKIERDRQ